MMRQQPPAAAAVILLLQVEPYFNETGSNCPSILPRQQQKELLELSVNSVKVSSSSSSTSNGSSSSSLRVSALQASHRAVLEYCVLAHSLHHCCCCCCSIRALGFNKGVFLVEQMHC
jgi:hypothetical protein